MSRITVIGAGPLGRATTRALLDRGDEVTVVTRSATVIPGASAVAVDITAPGSTSQFPDSDAIVACCNFPYGAWHRHWPPAIENLIAAAKQQDATLVIAGNLYAYGESATPFKESDEFRANYRNGRVRAAVWKAALEAHTEGRIRTVEVRGSDYIGPHTGENAHGGERLLRPALEGKTASIVGDPDQLHTWTAVSDFGALLARATTDSQMWGRPWHVPNAPACTIRELAAQALEISADENRIPVSAPPRIRKMPRALLSILSLVSPAMAGIRDAAYQFDAPFLVDDSDARTQLGVTHTPLRETLTEAVRALSHHRQPETA
ncbi:MAG: NAD-dependent epimerase/dehydratase family protein [Gulosibacter sp.]|uniref:NAD-dependent epimerase/dehydratase family protein n=1 Tax=Gulosibacter sp. TaxID=2817531 RepID=UPI003F8EDD86